MQGFQLAFLVGAGLMLGGAVVIVVLLRARHVAVDRDAEEPSPCAVAA